MAKKSTVLTPNEVLILAPQRIHFKNHEQSVGEIAPGRFSGSMPLQYVWELEVSLEPADTTHTLTCPLSN
jgi:hypothetical protein